MPKTSPSLDPDQHVFQFLRDDPSYQTNHLRAEITRDVERNIRRKLTERLSTIVVTSCYKLIEETVESAISRSIADTVTPLKKDFQNLVNHLQRPATDPADWWKEGNAPDTDDELPF